MKPVLLTSALLMLSACAQPIDAEAIAAADEAICSEAGFEAESDAFKLCLLMQKQERRLDRRLRLLELEIDSVHRLPFFRDRY